MIRPLLGPQCGAETPHGGILQHGEPVRGHGGEPVEQGAAARRGKGVRRGFAKDVGFEARGCDYADVVGEQVQGEVGIDGEEQHIAEFAVVRPFCVSQEVARAGFHLDADELAIRLKGEEVGATAVWESYFVNGGPGQAGT